MSATPSGRYSHVRRVVDSGKSVTRAMEKIEAIRAGYRPRRDEVFKRMKVTTFAQLAIQVARFDLSQNGMDANGNDFCDESINGELDSARTDRPNGVVDDRLAVDTPASIAITEGDFGRVSSSNMSIDSARSTLQSVISGVGEMDLSDELNTPRGPQLDPEKVLDGDCPYLLLDCRDPDDYFRCHIITAKSYPSAMLARTINFETKELSRYKNAHGKVVVLYDDEEKTAPRVATVLFERGYDNVFLLSGGLKQSCKVFPTHFISGTIPESITGKKVGKNFAPATETGFTHDDLNRIEDYLNYALTDKSVGTRLSKKVTAASEGRLTAASQLTGRISAAKSEVPASLSHRSAFKPP